VGKKVIMISKKWIAYGTAGLIGLSVIGGTAAASAANMDLHDGSGKVVPGSELNGRTGVLDVDTVTLQQRSDSVVTVVSTSSAPSAVSAVAPAAVSAPSATSAPSAPSTPSPVSAPSAPSITSPATPPSAASAASVSATD
jgi:hypothetical protein